MAESSVVNKKLDYSNSSALHSAAASNDISNVQYLLSQGANVNARTSMSLRTPLHYAAKNNKGDSHFEVAQLLLNNGADVNAKDHYGKTPLYLLVENGELKIIKLLLDFKADIHIIYDECNLIFFTVDFNKNIEVLQLLVDNGLDVNHSGNSGSTPLHWACNLNLDNIKIIKCLLKNNANMSAINQYGDTPLIRALRSRMETLSFEITIKKFAFILEHSNFDFIHKEFNIFYSEYLSHPDYLWKMFLKHAAKLESLNIAVHSTLLNIVSRQSKSCCYYKQCKAELLRAKNTKFENSWVTFYNLLVDGRKKLKNYAGNRNLIQDFVRSGLMTKFPIYGAAMYQNVKKGIKKRALFDKSTFLLSTCLPIFNPTHLIIRDILDCIMSKKDLMKFGDQN